MLKIKRYYQYWGKARPDCVGDPQYHLLAYHSLDVAAVGVAYLKKTPFFLKSCCALLRCSESAFLSWAAFFLALHDLGKFSFTFQAQRGDLMQLLDQEPGVVRASHERHDTLGYWLWDDLTEDTELLQALGFQLSDNSQLDLNYWMRAVCGHHGTPPKSHGPVDFFFHRHDKRAATEFISTIAGFLLNDEARAIPVIDDADFEQASTTLSWWFAGLAVLADWLGSNTRYFPYRTRARDLRVYWRHAQRRAQTALRAAGVLPVAIAPGKSLQDFFPYIQLASPLQQWAATVPLPAAPQIHLLEDVTGAGKTEAAMMLAYRLMAHGAAQGFFIGLPTMATANAMYRRVAEVYQKLFAGQASLALGHGFKDLVELFAATVLPPDASEGDPAQTDETASARCSAWLADHNKRVLLAPAGVGTVDQALLAVLHSKHQSLRLLGLFNKVLVIDEVHACDAYMQGILEVLLEFHARTDGSVILLSATLPAKMKQALLDAYARGRNQKRAPALARADYPLATRWHDGSSVLHEDALASRKNVSRTVQLRYLSDREQLYADIVAALRQGQCVGWIRNTVADAMAAYARLSQHVPAEKITLFHARFALYDRLQTEETILDYFGDKSDGEKRCGRLMIATQVAEQSLDVDFDILVSDLAPIDRLLQRAGRAQRHVRDASGNRLTLQGAVDGRPPPSLWVLAPPWQGEPKTDWYARTFPKGQYVYAHHGQLWQTAKLLQRDQFTMPLDARELIEAVYGEAVEFPAALQSNAVKAEGEQLSESSQAKLNTLKVSTGYQRGNLGGDMWSDVLTPSRLGEQSREVMLARWEGERLLPWADGVWAYSMVKVPAWQLEHAEMPVSVVQQAEVERVRATLPSQGKYCVLLCLTRQADGIWQGQAWTAPDADRKVPAELKMWLYDASFGLRLKESDANGAAPD